MTSLRTLLPHPWRAALVVAVLGLLAAAPAAHAQTVTSLYHPSSVSRDFATGSGGWSAGTSYSAGIPGVTTPELTNSFQASGGAGGDGDGFMQTNLGGLTALLNATSTATLTSPAFTYAGAEGEPATTATFWISRRSNVAALLALGNSADYSVALQRMNGDSVAETTALIATTTMDGATEWTPVGVQLDPQQLVIGSSYRFVITSTFQTLVGLLPSGSIGYDNVTLIASRETAGGGGDGGGGDGGGGDGGGDGGGGTNQLTNAEMKFVTNNSFVGRVVLKRQRLLVKVRCHRAARRACKITKLRAMVGGKRATNRRKLTLKRGETRKVALKLRSRRYVRQVRNRKRVTLRQTVRVGQKTRNASRRVKVRIR